MIIMLTLSLVLLMVICVRNVHEFPIPRGLWVASSIIAFACLANGSGIGFLVWIVFFVLALCASKGSSSLLGRLNYWLYRIYAYESWAQDSNNLVLRVCRCNGTPPQPAQPQPAQQPAQPAQPGMVITYQNRTCADLSVRPLWFNEGIIRLRLLGQNELFPGDEFHPRTRFGFRNPVKSIRLEKMGNTIYVLMHHWFDITDSSSNLAFCYDPEIRRTPLGLLFYVNEVSIKRQGEKEIKFFLRPHEAIIFKMAFTQMRNDTLNWQGIKVLTPPKG